MGLLLAPFNAKTIVVLLGAGNDSLKVRSVKSRNAILSKLCQEGQFEYLFEVISGSGKEPFSYACKSKQHICCKRSYEKNYY